MGEAPFDWSDFRRLAEEFASRKEEGYVRTAISRAYYFVYHLGRDRVEAEGLQVPRRGAHQYVWEKFRTSGNANHARLALLGQRLKQKREQADYDHLYERIDEDAAQVLALADQFASEPDLFVSLAPSGRSPI